MTTLYALVHICIIISCVIALHCAAKTIRARLHQHDRTLLLRAHGYYKEPFHEESQLLESNTETMKNLLGALTNHFSEDYFANRLADWAYAAVNLLTWIVRVTLAILLIALLWRVAMGEPLSVMSDLWLLPVVQIAGMACYVTAHYLCRMVTGRGLGEPHRANARYRQIYREIRTRQRRTAWQKL
tara:strand:- start:11713 stop:12267 length:555 start_codon:yes stop_codon:yes gene_type:complete